MWFFGQGRGSSEILVNLDPYDAMFLCYGFGFGYGGEDGIVRSLNVMW